VRTRVKGLSVVDCGLKINSSNIEVVFCVGLEEEIVTPSIPQTSEWEDQGVSSISPESCSTASQWSV
jgi:hypothetical protein